MCTWRFAHDSCTGGQTETDRQRPAKREQDKDTHTYKQGGERASEGHTHTQNTNTNALHTERAREENSTRDTLTAGVGDQVDTFEAELMEKVSKQQRSKMNRVQVCTVAQLMQSDNLRKLMAIQQVRRVRDGSSLRAHENRERRKGLWSGVPVSVGHFVRWHALLRS